MKRACKVVKIIGDKVANHSVINRANDLTKKLFIFYFKSDEYVCINLKFQGFELVPSISAKNTDVVFSRDFLI